MDIIAVGVRNEKDSELIRKLLSYVRIEEPKDASADKLFANDIEIRGGLEQFCSLKGITKLHFLVKSKSDDCSNLLSLEIFDDLIMLGRHSRLDLLAQRIEARKFEDGVWIICASEWEVDDKIYYFSGSAEALCQYMLLNGGPYRRIYSVTSNIYEVNDEIPFVWEIRPAKHFVADEVLSSQQIRPKAEEAFCEKSYARVVRLYGAIESQLSKVERKKLEYCRKRL